MSSNRCRPTESPATPPTMPPTMPPTTPPTAVPAPGTTEPMVAPISAPTSAPAIAPPQLPAIPAAASPVCLPIGVEKLISVGGDRHWKHHLAGRLQGRAGTAHLGIVSEVFCILGDFVGDPRRPAGPSYFGLNLDTLTVARVLGLDVDSHVVDAFPVLRRHLGSHLVLRAGIAACDCVAREARV